MAESRCSSCGAEIWWAMTLAGKNMPLDAEPSSDGNIRINDDGRAYVVGPLELLVPHVGHTYKSHFATCPHAAQHRRSDNS